MVAFWAEMGVAYLEINKLPCLHEIDIPKCINVYSIYRTKLGVIGFFVLSLYPRSPEGEGGILFYLCPSVQDIFRRIFLSNYQWQKSDIWSQASYTCRYAILWVAFLDPSDSYFLFADLVGFYTH